jgi:Protein of unknown function (DUF1822)
MLLNLEQIKAIDPTSIWLEITPDEIDRATPNSQLYSNPTGINNAQINQLCLTKFQTWLIDREITHQPSFNDNESTTIWDVVTGCAVEIGKLRLILIPTDNLDRSELRVPQEWLDLPSWAGDYYLGVQIDLDSNMLNIWGFASHQALKDRGRYSVRDRTYSLDSDLLVSNLDLLWIAEELALAPRNIVAELPNLSLERALELIQGLSQLSPYSPRLALNFAEWGAILNNPTLRSQLHQTRIQKNAIAQTPAATFRLVDWLQQEFTTALASGWESYRSVAVMSPAHNNTIERAKLIDLQVDLSCETVVLLVGIVPEANERVRVIVRVHPAIGSRYLPPQLQLSYVDPDGNSLRTVTARTNDDYIQLPAYTCPVGMEFNLQLQLQNARSIERFIV